MLPFIFIVLSVGVAAVVMYTSQSPRASAAIFLWVTLTALAAWAGWLRDFSSLPPAAPLLFAFGFIVAAVLGCSRFAEPLVRLSTSFLVGVQAFRILVELCIHRAVVEGIAPPQLTWSGLNFDIVTGVTAFLLFPFASRLPRGLLLLWNTLGLGLVTWVVVVAAISFPTRFQVLQPPNTWLAEFPYVWLPTVHVTAAILFHAALYRKLYRSEK